MREKSKAHTSQLATELMDVDFSQIPNIMNKHNVQQMIYGHTHRPSVYWRKYYRDRDSDNDNDDNNNNKNDDYNVFLKVVVLSDWGKQGNMLRCDDSGEQRLVYFD